MDFDLYNDQLKALTSRLDHVGRLIHPDVTAFAASPVCGSRVDIDLKLDKNGRITKIGCASEACALTRAVLAIFVESATGLGRPDISAAAQSFEGWLDDAHDTLPAGWEELSILLPARSYTMRHDSMMLPFRAALKALDKQGQ